MKRIAIPFLLLAVLLGLVAQPASAKPPLGVCPPAFDLGAKTLAETLALPKVVAGIAAGAFTAAGVQAAFQATDKNDDGKICLQTVPRSGVTPNPASGWQYAYNIADNNAGPRS